MSRSLFQVVIGVHSEARFWMTYECLFYIWFEENAGQRPVNLYSDELQVQTTKC